jgi:hypothetical protein
MATLRQYPHITRIRSLDQKAADVTRHRGEALVPTRTRLRALARPTHGVSTTDRVRMPGSIKPPLPVDAREGRLWPVALRRCP